jgi:hypothetical protein
MCGSSSISPKEFIFNINHTGCVGSKDSFFLMPRFVNSLLLENNFFESEGFYEVASAHVHPIKELTGISEKLARKVGERVVNMTVSPNDVKYCRSSMAANNMLLTRYLGLKKDTGETFMTIIGVDVKGRVVDIRHVDFGLIDDIEEMERLNDQAIESIKSGKPDLGVIAAHYEYFNDPRFSSDFGYECRIIQQMDDYNERLKIQAIDILLVDKDFPDPGLYRKIKRMKTNYPSMRVIMLADQVMPHELMKAQEHFIEGFCQKGDDYLTLINTIEQVIM